MIKILFILCCLLSVIEFIFHIFKISIPYFSISSKFYHELKNKPWAINNFHRRHAILCAIDTPLIAWAALGNILIRYRLICLCFIFLLDTIVYVIDKHSISNNSN